jgi:hypothetical protein
MRTIYPRLNEFDDGSESSSAANTRPPTPTTVLGLADMHIHSSRSSVSLASGSGSSSYAASISSSTPSAATNGPVACDTVLPPQNLAHRGTSPRPVSPTAPVETALFDVPVLEREEVWATGENAKGKGVDLGVIAPPGRKLCVRHQRMADGGMSLKLQRVRFSYNSTMSS